jgi:hypothetical protein
MAPHAANRHVLFTSYNIDGNLQYVDYGLWDALMDGVHPASQDEFLGGAMYDVPQIYLFLNNPEFKLTASRDGLLFFERGPASQSLVNRIVTRPLGSYRDTEPITDFGDVIRLIGFSVEDLNGHRYRLTFDWIGLSDLGEMPPLFAVSRLAGALQSRFPHLPTQVLYQTSSWRDEEVVREVFDIEIPYDIKPGTYTLLTGWYDSGSSYAFKTDARARVGSEVPVTSLTVFPAP